MRANWKMGFFQQENTEETFCLASLDGQTCNFKILPWSLAPILQHKSGDLTENASPVTKKTCGKNSPYYLTLAQIWKKAAMQHHSSSNFTRIHSLPVFSTPSEKVQRGLPHWQETTRLAVFRLTVMQREGTASHSSEIDHISTFSRQHNSVSGNHTLFPWRFPLEQFHFDSQELTLSVLYHLT